MADIVIDSITPTVGHAPVTATDSTGTYTVWELVDGASFSVNLPTGYIVGSDILLKVYEATPGQSLKHKWQVVTLTNGVNSQAFTFEYTSDATANTQTLRTMTISTSGTVNGVALAAGDLVDVTFTRIAATSNEDSNSIKVYTMIFSHSLASDVSVSGCNGRMGEIVDRVLSLINSTGATGSYIQTTDIIRWVNDCQKEFAKAGLFRKVDNITLVATHADYALATLFTDYRSLVKAWWIYDERWKLMDLRTWEAYQQAYAYSETDSVVYGYLLNGTTLTLWPTPTGAAVDAISIFYNYTPIALDCSTSYTPPTREDDDLTYVYFALREAHSRDDKSGRSDSNWAKYNSLFQKAFDDACRNHRKTSPVLGSYRF